MHVFVVSVINWVGLVLKLVQVGLFVICHVYVGTNFCVCCVCFCVCAVVEVLENLAFLANASNLVLYMIQYMHMSPSKSANNVTNFMGTAFLLALLGGFLCDAFLTTYHIYLISAVIEFLVCIFHHQSTISPF